MSPVRFLPPAFAFFAAAASLPAKPGTAPFVFDPIAPITAPFEMPQLTRPDFGPAIVDIRDHGATAGGEVKNTEAFARAIAACAEAGGGRVLVPAGRWFTGPIHLRSSIELHLAQDAEIVFSDRFEDYLPVVLVRVGGIELYNYSPLIYARDCTNVGITGPGRLNGNATAWWDWKTKETREIFRLAPNQVPVEQRIFGTPEAAIRPNFVVFFNCRNVLMEGFTIGGGPNWTLHPVYCENVVIRRVHVLTDGPNNDGIDPDSCRNVLIEHCVFDTGDDCVVLKSGYNEDGWRVGRPTENVVMRWCSSQRGHGGLVIGSEMSGDVRNVYVHDCDFAGTDRAVRIKSRRGRGGVVENVWAENLRVRDMQHEVVIMNMDYGADRNRAFSERAPLFRNIRLRNIVAEGAPVAIRIAGLEDSPIQNVAFTDLAIASREGVVASNVQNVRFQNVTLRVDSGPAYRLTNARDVLIRGAIGAAASTARGTNVPPADRLNGGTHPAESTPAFLHVAGARSENIRIETTSATLPTVTCSEGARLDAVAIVGPGVQSRPHHHNSLDEVISR